MKVSRFSPTSFGLAFILWSLSQAAAAASDIYPAGVACNGFDLQVDSVGSPTVQKTFKDTKNNVVRYLNAGTGVRVTFTNLQTGATLVLAPNGAVQNIRTVQESNVFTYITTGHNILILFPSDVPAGPTTTLYVGRIEFTVDANTGGTFTLLKTSGNSTDICALLSS
jgi:hypothetical protein